MNTIPPEVNKAAAMIARILAQRPWYDKDKKNWLLKQAKKHDELLKDYEVSQIFRNNDGKTTINNDMRNKHRMERVDFIRQYLLRLEPGTEFGVRDLSDWFHAAKPDSWEMVTLTPLRNDLGILIKEKLVDRRWEPSNGGTYIYWTTNQADPTLRHAVQTPVQAQEQITASYS